MQGKGKSPVWKKGSNLDNGVTSVENIHGASLSECGMGSKGVDQKPQGIYKKKVSTDRGSFRFR